MVQLNVLEQYDTNNTWFIICSVGAVFSIVFSIMGIKWWFRKRVTFQHDPVVENRDRAPQDEISVRTTGIYRRSFDADGFVDISNRSRPLPPVKVRQNNGRPMLPIRHSFPQDASLYQKYPEPEEVIEVSTANSVLPTSPPSTPITATIEDLSKPVVIDIHIPGDQTGVIETSNNLRTPEVHQRLSLDNEKPARNPPELEEVHIPSSLDKLPQKSEYAWPEKEDENAYLYAKVNKKKPVPLARDQTHEDNKQEPVLEAVAKSQELNECDAFIETVRKMSAVEIEEDAENELEVNQIKEDNVKSTDNYGTNMIEITHSKEIQIGNHLVIQKPVEEQSPTFIEADNVKVDDFKPEETSELNESESASSEIPVNPYLQEIESPLDVSKIVSPKPKKSKRGILKNRRAPLPPGMLNQEKQDQLSAAQEPNTKVNFNVENVTEDESIVEERKTKEVSFRDRESMIVTEVIYSPEYEYEEPTIQESVKIEIKEHIEEINESDSDVKITEVTVEECVTVIAVNQIPTELIQTVRNSEIEELKPMHTEEDEPIQMEHKLLIPIHDSHSDSKINQEFIENADEKSQAEAKNEDEAKEHLHEHKVRIIEPEDSHSVRESFSREPVPTPRRLGQIRIRTSSEDTWEPQTVVHNNQVLVCTPPPEHPPPVLPDSYLSDEEEEEEEDDQIYDENHPPKPPPRVRIYVINSDDPNDKNIKSILKSRQQEKKVSFDNSVPDVIPTTPETPNLIETQSPVITTPDDVLTVLSHSQIPTTPLTPDAENSPIVLKSQKPIQNEFTCQEVNNNTDTKNQNDIADDNKPDIINTTETIEKDESKLVINTTNNDNQTATADMNENKQQKLIVVDSPTNTNDVKIIDYIIKSHETKSDEDEPTSYITLCKVESNNKKLVSELHLNISDAVVESDQEQGDAGQILLGQMTPEDISRELDSSSKTNVFLLENVDETQRTNVAELKDEVQASKNKNMNLLEEKVAMFKALAEKMNAQSLNNVQGHVQKPTDIPGRSISVQADEEPKPKRMIRLLSAPALTPREALMAEIRAMGERRQASIDANHQNEVEQTEQKSNKKVIKVLQLEEDIECAI